jgi:hypothetical protein
MSELFWDEEFEWLEMLPVQDDGSDNLSIEEVVKRQEVLSEFLGVYIDRYVLIENSVITASDATLKGLMSRNKPGEPRRLPYEEGASFFRLAA